MCDEAAQQFPIPDPPPEPPISTTSAEAEMSLAVAALEYKGFLSGTLASHIHSDWRLRFWLRTLFFFFALGINLWWDDNVRDMVWQSGRAGSSYHLSDSVLIALLTTSVANFLALLVIIAKHLFSHNPEDKPASEDATTP